MRLAARRLPSPGEKKLQAPRTIRIPFIRRCTVTRASSEQPGSLIDLSVNGVYVSTAPLPEQAEQLSVSFRVPGNARLVRIAGLVVWTHPQQTHPVHGIPPGFGFRFLEVAPPDAALIERIIIAYCQSNPLYRRYL